MILAKVLRKRVVVNLCLKGMVDDTDKMREWPKIGFEYLFLLQTLDHFREFGCWIHGAGGSLVKEKRGFISRITHGLFLEELIEMHGA